ncbi:MAG TPA: hypothetical protein VFX05_17685 [Casimicrobiaceae bacterium]|nr:hypothetical protein [Casimicrobiaceae bacterium]
MPGATARAEAIGVTEGARAAESARAPGLARWRLGAYALALVFAVAWTLLLGKDLHWDAANYHLYLGWSAFNDRFALDFFGAGTPSYLNPAPLVPLYLMWRADWSALGIAVTFAAFHGILLMLTFELAVAAGLRRSASGLPAFALLAMVLAATNPVLLQVLGSTMTDPSVGVLVLGGWLALAYALRGGDARTAALAGALLGLGAALKLSNALFAVAAAPALLLMPGTVPARLRGLAAFCAASGAAFVLAALPWSWKLWHEFGNPFFPFLNEVFRSPDFTTAPIAQQRFIPLTWQAYVLRPIDMLAAASAVHVEPRAPDLRYVALLAALAVLWIARLSRRGAVATQDDDAASRRCFAGLLVGLLVAWCLWLAVSGHGRYFLPMACVASAGLALALQRLHALLPSTTIGAAMILLFLQVMQLALGTDLGREGLAWEGPWVRVEVPGRLRNEPSFHVAPVFMSGSLFMPYLHPQSGIVNVGGFNVLAPETPGGARAQRLLDRNVDRLRLLLPLPDGVRDRATLPGPPEALRVHVRRFGLRVDGSDCEFLRFEANLRGERRPTSDRWKHFISCRLVPAPEERVAFEREASVYDPAFDHVERACPRLFFPARGVTQEFPYWGRTYPMGSEFQLYVEEGRLKYYFYLRGGEAIDIGTLDAWRLGPQPIDCTVRFKPAFANIVRR